MIIRRLIVGPRWLERFNKYYDMRKLCYRYAINEVWVEDLDRCYQYDLDK